MKSSEQLFERMVLSASRMQPKDRIRFARTVVIPLLAHITDSVMHLPDDTETANTFELSQQMTAHLETLDDLLLRKIASTLAANLPLEGTANHA